MGAEGKAGVNGEPLYQSAGVCPVDSRSLLGHASPYPSSPAPDNELSTGLVIGAVCHPSMLIRAAQGCNPAGTISRNGSSSMQAGTIAQIGNSIRRRAGTATGEPMQVRAQIAHPVLSCPCPCSPRLP